MICKHENREKISTIIEGKYYSNMCRDCLSSVHSNSSLSSGHQSFERRRTYEDYAQDAVQPYDAMGNPRSEFYRLYPEQAKKIFTPDEISKVKREI